MEIPVYVINGFLEAGKTSFIKSTLQDEDFSGGEKTLLLLCEEGIEEFDEKFLKKYNCVVEVVEEEEELNSDLLEELNRKHKPKKVMFECNGMWMMKNVFDSVPDGIWQIVQVITIVNNTTFSVYANNMKSLLADQVTNSEMVIFNRCEESDELVISRRMIKALNRRAQVFFEDERGELIDVQDDVLPFDINADVIEVEDDDYGIWYIDAMDHPDKYNGKIIKMKGIVYKPKNYPKQCFAFGRHAMTCCADDIQFIGSICVYENAKELKEGDWIVLTGEIESKYNPEYNENVIFIKCKSYEKSQQPKDEIVYFS